MRPRRGAGERDQGGESITPFDISVNFVVECETDTEAMETLARLMRLDAAEGFKAIYECSIDEPQELEEHEAKDYRA